MEKKRLNLSIKTSVWQDIKTRPTFRPSEWFEEQYEKSFKNKERINEEITKHKEKIELLNQEIIAAEERERAWSLKFTREERRYLRTIPKLITEGKDVKAIHRAFCTTHHKISFYDFKNAYIFWSEQEKE